MAEKNKNDAAEEFLRTVQEEIGKVEETLRTHVSDEVAKRFEATAGELKGLREELTKKLEEGAHPADETVQDMEKRLKTAEESLRALTLKAEQVALGSKDKGNEARDAELFKGLFLKDFEEFKKRIRAFHSGGTGENIRAISSDLFTTGGKLSAETADRFLDFVIDKTTALRRVTTRRMMSPEGHTDELTISTRRLRKASEGTEPSVSNAVGTNRRTMNTVEVIWAEDLTLTFLEDNIERRGAEAHIAQLLGRQFGSDLNDLAWNGNAEADVSQDDAFLTINDGWIQLALEDSEVNDVDASTLSSPSQSDILSTAYRALPVEFQGLMDLGFFVPVGFAQRYAEELSDRQTALGDQVMVRGFPVLTYFGWPVIPEPHLYEDNPDRATFGPLSNLHHGIQRQMTVDSEWRPRKRAVEFTITARNDYQYATGKGLVLVSSIPAGNR